MAAGAYHRVRGDLSRVSRLSVRAASGLTVLQHCGRSDVGKPVIRAFCGESRPDTDGSEGEMTDACAAIQSPITE